MEDILKWQYDRLVKELLLLQDHQADKSCPCEAGGEMCVRKHLLSIEAYAEETIPMEENLEYRDRLTMLSDEAKKHRDREERALRDEDVPDDLANWARDWRKQFEKHSLNLQPAQNDSP
jgi:hypothetical protein